MRDNEEEKKPTKGLRGMKGTKTECALLRPNGERWVWRRSAKLVS